MTVYEPTARSEVSKLRLVPVPVLTGDPLTRTVSSPVGVPVVDSVAVNVTCSPSWLGLTEDVSVSVVARRLTTCTNVSEMLGSWSASPLYSAVRLWLPTPSAVVVSVALPISIAVRPVTSTGTELFVVEPSPS